MNQSVIARVIIAICLVSLDLFASGGVPDTTLERLETRANTLYPEAVQVRRQLHRIPEPCFQENETSRFIADYLKRLGLAVETGIGGTGIKATIRGTKEKPVVGIRADMDALPIPEETGLPFTSTNRGFMHACGHDGHMTYALMAATMLSEMRDRIPGTIVFLFQPCEEGTSDGTPSGAQTMIDAGALQNPKIDIMLGLHGMPGKTGSVSFREGPLMANVAFLTVTIRGKSSHGAAPHQGIDAIYASATAIQQFQSLISRAKDPYQQAVLTIGTINGGVRQNVIAEEVTMAGTVRTFDFDTENMIEAGMLKILDGLAVSTGITYDLQFHRAAKFVNNDADLAKMAFPLFERILGKENVSVSRPMTVGEDFAAYSHTIPSLFFFLGIGENRSLHTPDFSIDEAALKTGPVLLSAAALEYLYRASSGK